LKYTGLRLRPSTLFFTLTSKEVLFFRALLRSNSGRYI